MIQVKFSTNTTRSNKTADKDMTIKAFLTANNVDYSAASVHLEGVTLDAAGINSTFASHNITDECYLAVITKQTCAVL